MKWLSLMIPGKDPQGHPIISVLAKATWSIAKGSVVISEHQVPFVKCDQFSDPLCPHLSEVLAESDVLAYKLLPDVVFRGNAFVPGGRMAHYITCSVCVGALSKEIRVFGERTLRIGLFNRISDPLPFSSVEICYKKAFGGISKTKKGIPVICAPNPIGCGFVHKDQLKGGDELKLPSQEDPETPLDFDIIACGRMESWADFPLPASLGWTRRDFYPRCTFAGAGQGMLENPPNFDFRFYQGASDGLWGKPLNGDERVVLKNLDPYAADFEFVLPGTKPVIWVNKGKGKQVLDPVLQTLVIDKKEDLLTIVYRGSAFYEGVESLGDYVIEYGVE